MGEKIYVAKQDTLLEVQQTVNKTDTTIGDIGDPAGEESLVGLIKNIPETVPTGAVKSRQEIVISDDRTPQSLEDANFNNLCYKDYTISPVDMNKSVIICSNGGTVVRDNQFPVARFIDNKTVRVYVTYFEEPPSDNHIKSTYVQIIEFF